MSDLRDDPEVRADGSCVVCRRPKLTRQLKPLYTRALETDPFCSSQCAREWWGTQLPPVGRDVPAEIRFEKPPPDCMCKIAAGGGVV